MITRRTFIGLAGAATASTFFPASAWADFELPPTEWENWKKTLFDPAFPRKYLSNRHTDARMHLGGIGTGNFELGADGQLTTWQLWNNLRDGNVPFHFAIKAGATAKLLQTAGGPDWPRVKQIEMTGDYPLASLRFHDDELPVAVELTAFSPFSPLDLALSSTPAACFQFKLSNPSQRAQEVSLAAFLCNPIGYSGIGRIENGRHASVGANVNEAFREGDAAGFVLSAHEGLEPSVDAPVTLCVLKDPFVAPPDPHVGETNYAYVAPRDIAIPPLDRPDGLKVEIIDPKQFSTKSPKPLIWLDDADLSIPAPLLASICDAVRSGAVLVFSGRSMPLLAVFAGGTTGLDLTELLEELLPIRMTGVRAGQGTVEFDGLALIHDAVKSTAPNGLAQFTRAYGAGKVVVLGGQLLDPAHTDSTRVRQEAYAALCGLVGVKYTMTEGQSSKAPGFGSLALGVLAGDASGLASFDDWSTAWSQFSAKGAFDPLAGQSSQPTPLGRTGNCALAATVSIPPGGEAAIPFILTWRFPNKYSAAGQWVGTHYATQWPDARAVMKMAVDSFAAWTEKTQAFRRAFYDSTLPYWLLDAVTANAGITRHAGVVFRLANGDVYGWEGSNGSCQPTCTHVWGYEQSFAHLFPQLEKEMRRIDFKHQQRADGGIDNRTEVPSPPHPTGEQPFSDGHSSCILKAYREALNSTDESFFSDYWPNVKRATEYLIARDAAAAGGKPSGVLQDEQWNTYDEALHGVTTFISGYYLAALRAAEEWATRMGETDTAQRFHSIFESGRDKLVELCWNGEYFEQHLADYATRKGEVGPGCMSDQLIGQWWAHQLNLGYILPEEKVKSSLRAIVKYNFKSDLTGWKHSPRAFAGPGDKGLIICTWPRGGRPANVMLYSDEVWTGIEYQVAAHLIYEGMVEEGFAIVKGARDRYDGVPRPPIGRNPWCEIECGGHYTRAMSSWSLLLALSGFHYDGPRQRMRVAPQHKPENFKSFFTTTEGWGSASQRLFGGKQAVAFDVVAGQLPVKSLDLRTSAPSGNVSVLLAGKALRQSADFADGQCHIQLADAGVIAHPGEKLEITIG